MKYILMMNTMKAGADAFGSWPTEGHPGAHRIHDRPQQGAARIPESWSSAEGLAFPAEAKLVRAGKDGAPITDGVFPESKEFLAGYWIVDVESPERAYADRRPGVGGAWARWSRR